MHTITHPLQQGGPAADMITALKPHASVSVQDLTPWPRFGVKGVGSAEWFAAQGLALPAINRQTVHCGIIILRLGTNDIVCLSATGHGADLDALRHRWNSAAAPKGYASWREEGWAWLRLTGPALDDLMSRLCAVDLRPRSFATDETAQTRFAHADAIVFRSESGFDVLFDITITAHVLAAIEAARHAIHAGDGT